MCRCFCIVMISNKEKPACKAQHMEMEVSFTGRESQWDFGHTGDVALPSSARRTPAVTAQQRHCTATVYQDSQEGSLTAHACPHTDPLQPSSSKFLCEHLYFSLDRLVPHKRLQHSYWDSRHSWFKAKQSQAHISLHWFKITL